MSTKYVMEKYGWPYDAVLLAGFCMQYAAIIFGGVMIFELGAKA